MIVRAPYQPVSGRSGLPSVEVTRSGTTTTISLHGTFAKPDTRPFNNAMAGAVQSSSACIVDLRYCTACDGPALQLLFRYKTWLADRLAIVVAETGPVRSAIERCGYSRLLGITTSLELATELVSAAPLGAR